MQTQAYQRPPLTSFYRNYPSFETATAKEQASSQKSVRVLAGEGYRGQVKKHCLKTALKY